MDNLRIDNHKLIYHVERVSQWKKGGLIAPIYMEIAPSGGCNHRCIFCALDYIGYKPRFLDPKVLKAAIKDAAKYGVKSVMFAGEGEPLLHEDIDSIIGFTKHSGLDVSVTTNGVFLNDRLIKDCLGFLSWVRVSFNAGSSKAYEKIHHSAKGDFKKALLNLEKAVRFKKAHRLICTIGVQMLLIPENVNEVVKLAKVLKDIGVDYFTVKPFSKHPMSICNIDRNFDYRKFLFLEKKLSRLAAKDFKIIFRSHTMEKLKEPRF